MVPDGAEVTSPPGQICHNTTRARDRRQQPGRGLGLADQPEDRARHIEAERPVIHGVVAVVGAVEESPREPGVEALVVMEGSSPQRGQAGHQAEQPPGRSPRCGAFSQRRPGRGMHPSGDPRSPDLRVRRRLVAGCPPASSPTCRRSDRRAAPAAPESAHRRRRSPTYVDVEGEHRPRNRHRHGRVVRSRGRGVRTWSRRVSKPYRRRGDRARSARALSGPNRAMRVRSGASGQGTERRVDVEASRP